MRKLLNASYSSEIEGISQFRFKRLDSPFTQHDILVAAGEKLLGGKKPFLDGGGRSTF